MAGVFIMFWVMFASALKEKLSPPVADFITFFWSMRASVPKEKV
jgi:hypothetical protein